MKKLAGFHT